MKKVAIVGAGASGLIAAYFASEKCEVHIFEKDRRAGRKILISGNGRCNITNSFIDSSRYHGHNKNFVNNIFGKFGQEETIALFNSLGLPLVEKQDGKLFPASLQSSTVVNIFEYELKRRGVNRHLQSKITGIRDRAGRFMVTTSHGKEIEFDSVILSCGSCAYPSVGGSKAGYELARSIGHKVYDPFPVIQPLNIKDKPLHRLQGIKWDCGLSVIKDGKTMDSSQGELLFTAYGISGPATLSISRSVNEIIRSGNEVLVELDLFPDLGKDELSGLLDSVWADESKKLSFSLYGILKEKVPEVILEMSGVNPDMRVSEVSGNLKERILSSLKGTKLRPGKLRSFEDAVAASGGVSVDEIDPGTMESRLNSGIYITGELLDIDGESGGFNLQFAWSTGAIAGMAQSN